MDKDLKKLGVAIRAARAAVGVGQSDFADAIGVSQSTVARLETFRGTFPSNALLCSIRFFKSHGVTFGDFSDGPVILTISEDTIHNMESG